MRLAKLASLILKEKLGLTDQETFKQIRENPYLQYLLGWEAYREEQRFDPSMMVHFRKRLSDSVVSKINELLIEQASTRSNDPEDDHDESASGSAQESEDLPKAVEAFRRRHGRPKKDPSADETHQILADERAHIPIERALGRAKRAFSLSRVMAKRANTAATEQSPA